MHPVVEDDDPAILMSFEHPSPEVQRAPAGPVIEELPPSSSPVNEEMAIVLFKPIGSLLLHQQSLSTLSVSVDPYLISGFKSKLLNLLRSFTFFRMCSRVWCAVCCTCDDCHSGKETIMAVYV